MHAHVHAVGEAFAHDQAQTQAITATCAKWHKWEIQLLLGKALAVVDDADAACKRLKAHFAGACLYAVQNTIHQYLFELEWLGFEADVGVTL